MTKAELERRIRHLERDRELLLTVASKDGQAVVRTAKRWSKTWVRELNAAGIAMTRAELALHRAVLRLEKREKRNERR